MATADLLVRFLADTSDIASATKNLDGTGERIKGWAKGVGVAIAGAFAVDKVIDFTKQAIGAASDLEESSSKVGVVFGDQASSILEWSKNSATAMGISQQAALEAAGTYGNLAVALGLPQDKAADMSKSLVGLAGDLASFNNVPVGDALDALRSGLTGETEPLKKFGINLNEAALKQEALAMGLSDGKGTLDAAAKAQAAYSLILKQSGTAQGDFARTSGGLANQQKIAAAQFENMKAQLGTALMPILQQLVSILNQYLIPALTKVATFVSDNTSWLVPLAAAIGGVVLAMKAWNAVTDIAETVQKSYTAAVKLFSAEGAIAKAATAAWTVVQAAFNLVMSANPIMLTVIAIAALVAGIVIAYKNVEWFRDLVDAAFGAILAAIQFVWNWVSNNWPLLLAILTGPFGTAVYLIVKNWDTIKAVIVGVFDWIRNNWPLLLAIITGPIGLAVLAITRNWDTIKEGASAAWQWVKDKFNDLVSFFTGMPQRIAQAARNMFTGLVDAFKSALNLIIRAWNALDIGIDISIPDWVPPPFGGRGFEIKDIFPDIPYLAKGGIVTGPTLAMLGEGRGPEAVIPLDSMGGLMGGTIDARVIVNGPVYGVDDLNAWADERDRRLATVLSSGRRP